MKCTLAKSSQWLKRSILVKNLPPKIQSDVMSLLTLKQTQAPADIYKKVKAEVLRIHAPQKEETFKKALSRVLTGLPSQLGQVLVNDICKKPVKLVGCCCATAVYTLWALQLPLTIRSQVANMTFSAETYTEVFNAADKIYLSTKATDLSAGVAAIVTTTPEVAAVKSNKNNKGGKNNKGNSSGNSSNNSGGGAGKPPGKKPSVPDGCCDNHRKWAEKAWFCLDPHRCPLASKTSPRPADKQKNYNKN